MLVLVDLLRGIGNTSQNGKGVHMRKRSILGWIGVAGAVAASYTMLDNQKKHRIKFKTKSMVDRFLNKKYRTFPLEEAGHPIDDNIENADMVSEGSQFGVNYYQETKQ